MINNLSKTHQHNELHAKARAVRAAVGAAIVASLAAGCATTQSPESLKATIRRTEMGVPHILADNWKNLGYGVGYTQAQDRICDLAELYVTARAERSYYWGGANGNLESDFYRQRLIDSGVTPALLRDPEVSWDRDYRDLVSGFVAGYNKYVRETPSAKLPVACRNQPWVKEITELDYFLNRAAGRRGPLDYVPEISNASPPKPEGAIAAALQSTDRDLVSFDSFADEHATVDGSNGWALGPATTQNGSAMLLASPHWPWEAFNKPGFWAQRVTMAHMTIPGVFNHIGVSRLGSAVQQIGHSDHIARTHTVSAVQRDVVYKLKLDPSDPTRYLYDGQSRAMERHPVTVRVREADGSIISKQRTLYWTHFGPVLLSKDRPWDTSTAYTLRSVMTALERLKVEEHKLALDRAKSTSQVLEILSRYQVQDTNTIAIDRQGNTLFADIGNIPHLDNALIARCGSKRQLDGSRSECELGTDPDSARAGIFGPKRGAVVHQKAFVANSNNPPRYANPEFPLTHLDDVFGKPGVPLSLRARLGLQLIEERMAGTDGMDGKRFSFENLQQMFLRTRVHSAELVLDDLLKACGPRPEVTLANGSLVDLRKACAVLSKWDRTYKIDSKGAHIFREFIREGGVQFLDKVDPTRPLATPRQLDVNNPTVLQALGRAVSRIKSAGIALDAELGSIQTARRGDLRIPVPGGASNDGVFNYMDVSPLMSGTYDAKGATGLFYFVEFGPKIRSRGMLIYGISSDPDSQHFADQMEAYSHGKVLDWRFDEADIASDPSLRTLTISGR